MLPEIKKIIKFLKQKNISEEKIKAWFNTEQEQYLGLSPADFIKVSPSNHSKIVLEDLQKKFYGEAMGV